MAKRLFSTPKDLLEGYCKLSEPYHLDNNICKPKSGEGRRKVYLLGRILKSGNISLYRYSCVEGKKVRESLKTILCVETSLQVKQENEKKLLFHVTETNRINEDLIRRDANFSPRPKTLLSITDYIRKKAQESLNETGNRHSNFAIFSSLAKHIESCFGNRVSFKDINLSWVRDFIHYLRHDAANINYTRTSDEERRKFPGLSQNTQHRMMANLSTILIDAVKKGYISENPIEKLSKNEKIRAEADTRTFLDIEEVEKLRNTPFIHSKVYSDIKPAFLFACFVGLRYSDLQSLKFSDFIKAKDGLRLRIRMKKTGRLLEVYVPEVAFNLLRNDDGREFVFKLPKNDYANEALKKWAQDAGISGKNLTFHVSRHTAATVLLSYGKPLAVVQEQLGHSKIQTTAVYTKLLDEAKKGAANAMDDIFNK